MHVYLADKHLDIRHVAQIGAVYPPPKGVAYHGWYATHLRALEAGRALALHHPNKVVWGVDQGPGIGERTHWLLVPISGTYCWSRYLDPRRYTG